MKRTLTLAGVAVVAARLSGLDVDEVLDELERTVVEQVLDRAAGAERPEVAAAIVLHGLLTEARFDAAPEPVAVFSALQLLASHDLTLREETLAALVAAITDGDADVEATAEWIRFHLDSREQPTPAIVGSRLGFPRGHTLQGALATGGYVGLRRALLDMTPQQVRDEVQRSMLTGRSGGASFPTSAKWDALAPGERVLVVNGDESEPGFFKDHHLLLHDPHQLIEGAVICAYAIGAPTVFVYVRGEMALGIERLTDAVNDAYAAGYLGEDIFGSGVGCDLVVHPGAGAYIVGEETALLESLEGKRGFPRMKPPYYPAAIGLYGNPTIVNNVETLSTLPWIVRNGGEAYADLGGGRYRGTRLFSVSGAVARPGIYELELHQRTFRDLLYDPAFGGGLRRDDAALTAFIPGASFPWFFPEHLDLPLDGDEVVANGSSLGAGILVLDDSVCPVRTAWRLTTFFARESCGQCTPCREGTDWLSKILHRIENGDGRLSDLDLLLDVGENISPGPFPHPARPDLGLPPQPFPYRQTTICPLGPSAVSPIDSSVYRFRDHYLAHITQRGCPWGGRRPETAIAPVPRAAVSIGKGGAG